MMGLDSLKRAQLNSILEQYYGATVTPEFLFDVNTTFEQLLNTIDVIVIDVFNEQKQKDRKPIIRTIDMSAVEEGEEPVPQRPVYSPPERTFCQKFCCQIR